MAASRDNTGRVHRRLRQHILRGDLPAGTALSQARIARELGVSRGPVREALRLLQREGLIDAKVNQRARVAPFSVHDLEELYALRVVVEALAIGVSVPQFTDDDLSQLGCALAEMEKLSGGDVLTWEVPHRRFHETLVQYAGARTVSTTRQLFDHSERYRVLYKAHGPRAWSIGEAEHREIAEACFARDAAGASARLARHLARTALTVLALVEPDHDPALVRTAVSQATGEPDASPRALTG